MQEQDSAHKKAQLALWLAMLKTPMAVEVWQRKQELAAWQVEKIIVY